MLTMLRGRGRGEMEKEIEMINHLKTYLDGFFVVAIC